MNKERRDRVVELCAQVAHEANRAYCQMLGDASQPHWPEAPEWQQESARVGVRLALEGESNPEKTHQAWLEHKLACGWKYGPVKDPEKKEHPCMVPYADLPKEQRKKDALFLEVVRAVGAVFMEG